MKKILKSLWIVFCIILLFLFIISCFSAFIAPSFFSYITLFTLAFPYLFLLTLITALINFYVNKKLGFVILLCMPPALFNLSHTIAFNFPKNFSDKKDENTFRIMTWNVQDFVNLSPQSDVRSKMLTIIHQKDPDVLCIQELTNVEGGRWRVSVRKELDSLGYNYYFFSNDWVTTNKHDALVTRGSAIFSKTPITDSGRVKINQEDGITEKLIYVNTEFNKRLLRIYTAHLASYQLYKDTDKVQKDIYEITYNRKRDIQYKLREVEQLPSKEKPKFIYDTVSKAVVSCWFILR
jgi:hypothetical protein